MGQVRWSCAFDFTALWHEKQAWAVTRSCCVTHPLVTNDQCHLNSLFCSRLQRLSSALELLSTAGDGRHTGKSS